MKEFFVWDGIELIQHAQLLIEIKNRYVQNIKSCLWKRGIAQVGIPGYLQGGSQKYCSGWKPLNF